MLDNENIEIGNRIKQRRLSMGLTLGEVASKIGVAISTIQRYEAGTISKIKLPVIQAIAGALDVNPAWLIGKSNEIKPVRKNEGASSHEFVNNDPELTELLERVRDDPNYRMLFSVTKDATPDDIEKAIKIIQMLKGE